MPVKAGGLDIRQAASLALSAYLASATSTPSLQDLILIRSVAVADKYYILYHSNWSSANIQSFPLDATACKQHAWDEPIVKDDINHLFATASQQDKSRLLAVKSHSIDWLHALSIASGSLRLANEDIRVTVGLCLGAALCQAHQCPCGVLAQFNGLHGLSCKLGSGKHSRLASINDIIYRAWCRADIPAVEEPTGLTRTDSKRPNGNTLVPRSVGKCVFWDVTIADTMAPSYLAISLVSTGLVAEQSSARKLAKYSELVISHIFVPIAMDSFGPICAEALIFSNELGRRISVVTIDMRETTFFFQRLSIAIQRFYCILFKSSLIDDVNVPESFLFEWLRPMLIIWCSWLTITLFYCLFLIFFYWMCVGLIKWYNNKK